MSTLLCEVSENAPPVCLFRENPNRLVTLWDLVNLYNAVGLCATFTQLARHIETLKCFAREHGRTADLLPDTRAEIIQCVQLAATIAGELGFDSARHQARQVYRRLSVQGRLYSVETIQDKLEDLSATLTRELQHLKFVVIAPQSDEYFSEKLFGEKVYEKFRPARDDVRDAGECLALGHGTAAVFHLMRASEHGLRALAKKLGVKLIDKKKPQPLEYADWNKVITACKSAIDKARELHASAKKQAKLELYSRAADTCEYMKDVWRNNICHTRKRYTASEATAVLERIRDFMGFVAELV